ncbi:MAG: heavy metal-binding domain-containing protein [Acidimicrobiales bacterium]
MTDTAGRGAFDSGLTTPDFAACLSMGLQPVALVQGFYVGQLGAWSSYRATPSHTYPCPWGWRGTNEHPPPGWIGTQDAVDEAWATAFATAHQRLLQEAQAVGAHGVVGIRVDMSHPTSQQSSEVHLYGTAVRLAGAGRGAVWTTRIAGHKLAKLVEAGYAPASVLYARCTAVMYEGCYMEHYGSSMVPAGTALTPIQDVHNLARSRALQQAWQLTGGHSLYDVELSAHETEGQTMYVSCQVLGSVVRRVRPTLPLGTPVATVALRD